MTRWTVRVRFLGILIAVGTCPCPAAAGEIGVNDEALRIVAQYKGVFRAPPKRVPTDKVVDGPILGNGDLGVAIGGPPEAQRFWLAKNDFWRLKSKYNTSGPRVFGGIDIYIPGLKDAGYRIEQELYEPVTIATLPPHTGQQWPISITAW